MNFEEATEFLYKYIPSGIKYDNPQKGLDRARRFLELLGNPQNKLKNIHIAGTSGKGSTCFLMKTLLESLGFKVGMLTSPHVKDVTERIQVGDAINKELFAETMTELADAMNKVPGITFFEILTGMAFLIFEKEEVDYAVIETGLGGKYDATNTIDVEKLSIITRIGLDHTKFLGDTVEKIAEQKAGIITGKCITTKQETVEVFRKYCNDLEVVEIPVCQYTKGKMRFTFEKENYVLGMIGKHQAENCSLALTALSYLSERDGFEIRKKKVKSALESSNFIGRFDRKKIHGNEIIFDIAHNEQKMSSLCETLQEIYPDEKFTFVLAFKDGKDYKSFEGNAESNLDRYFANDLGKLVILR